MAPIRASLLALLLVPVLLAGCTVNMGSRAAFGDIEVTMTVRSVQVIPGRCFDGSAAFGEECHAVRLDFHNPSGSDVSVRMGWSASDVAGGGASNGDQQGFDQVGAGKTEPMTVRFTLAKGAPHLDRIQYHGFPGARGEADIPAY